jgi:predicted transcriptional regulator of viral defense system
MKNDSSKSLASYVIELLAAGRIVFSDAEAESAIGTNHGAFLDAAEKLQKRRQISRLRRGFYVVVPPQYLNWESPPPSWFIDDLMRHEQASYYVGLLKAAELHGAAHQAVMEFQVMTNKRMPAIRAGRSRIAFYYRKDLPATSAAIENYKTDTGAMKISSVELTIFDLIRYPRANGGLDNAVTVISELGSKIRASNLVSLSKAFEKTTIQRAGYILDLLGLKEIADELQSSIDKQGLPWVELETSPGSKDALTSPVIARDARWRVVVRRIPESEA